MRNRLEEGQFGDEGRKLRAHGRRACQIRPHGRGGGAALRGDIAGGLALVVLFTLANTNVSERVREMATLKVLGFFDREVHHYVDPWRS